MQKKKKGFEFQESTSKLNRISKTTNIVFNVIFIILALVCIIPVVFIFMISISAEESIKLNVLFQKLFHWMPISSYLMRHR